MDPFQMVHSPQKLDMLNLKMMLSKRNVLFEVDFFAGSMLTFEGIRLILRCRSMAMALPHFLCLFFFFVRKVLVMNLACHWQNATIAKKGTMGLLGPSWINRRLLFPTREGSEICFIFPFQRGGSKMVIQIFKIPPVVFLEMFYARHMNISPQQTPGRLYKDCRQQWKLSSTRSMSST